MSRARRDLDAEHQSEWRPCCLIQSVAVGESRADVSANPAISDVRIWQQMASFPGKVDRHDGVQTVLGLGAAPRRSWATLLYY
jgi:hypothetical protein